MKFTASQDGTAFGTFPTWGDAYAGIRARAGNADTWSQDSVEARKQAQTPDAITAFSGGFTIERN